MFASAKHATLLIVLPLVLVAAVLTGCAATAETNPPRASSAPASSTAPAPSAGQGPSAGHAPSTAPAKTPGSALAALATLRIKGRAPLTGYSRDEFGDGWATVDGCDERDRMLTRDLAKRTYEAGSACYVTSGILNDPYTRAQIRYVRGASEVDIDHVVALADAWQKGAERWGRSRREAFANDPLELLAVSAHANRAKGDGDAATWLPPNKAFRCDYVARQIAVKRRYDVWVTRAEHDAMARVLAACPNERLTR